ncbi:MAG: hypothetical protein Q4A25_00740 [Candidatus Saccharibacteria bacterium]|nr:hypothetical protein [Candidatus Saccharibacteria bacterium]
MRSKSGFTILETALAMAFISFLMLAIGFAVIQISNIYQKGITIKVLNNNGRELVDEFSRTILASKYDKVEDSEDSHFDYTFTEVREELYGVGTRGENDGTGEEKLQLHGAFCLGNYSYIWNTGYALDLPDSGGDSTQIPVDGGQKEYSTKKAYLIVGEDDPNTPENETETKINFRLARVPDSGREVCRSNAKNKEDNKPNEYVVTKTKANNYVEILSESENQLVLYDLTVFEPIYHPGTGHALYSASFILGTADGGIDITVPGNFCTDKPENLKTDFNYCSINKFNFAARATGGLAI